MSLVLFNAPMTDPDGNPVDASVPMGLMFALPIMYLVLGYVMTAVGALIYNFTSRFTGGVQFELSEKSES
ncbi:DUF3566 domain-containing protein [Microbulbifer sp. 2201CG32-9]|uniref:DUF3566 domain-containing protein n=1 Tax=Microbulbifer sp. 2201CG32-9 TaxID=3232309 RepID=UPI00345C5703